MKTRTFQLTSTLNVNLTPVQNVARPQNAIRALKPEFFKRRVFAVATDDSSLPSATVSLQSSPPLVPSDALTQARCSTRGRELQHDLRIVDGLRRVRDRRTLTPSLRQMKLKISRLEMRLHYTKS